MASFRPVQNSPVTVRTIDFQQFSVPIFCCLYFKWYFDSTAIQVKSLWIFKRKISLCRKSSIKLTFRPLNLVSIFITFCICSFKKLYTYSSKRVCWPSVITVILQSKTIHVCCHMNWTVNLNTCTCIKYTLYKKNCFVKWENRSNSHISGLL